MSPCDDAEQSSAIWWSKMPSETDQVLAAEYALGLLESPGAIRFEARLRTDRSLGQDVAFWEDRLAESLALADAETPSRHVLGRVEASLFGVDQAPTALHGSFPWKKFAIGVLCFKLALLSAWYLTQPSRTVPESPSNQAPDTLILE